MNVSVNSWLALPVALRWTGELACWQVGFIPAAPVTIQRNKRLMMDGVDQILVFFVQFQKSEAYIQYML